MGLVNLIRDLGAAPDEASLLGDRHQGHGVPVNCDRLITVRVPEDDVGDPELANLNIQTTVISEACISIFPNFTSSSDKILRASSVLRL